MTDIVKIYWSKGNSDTLAVVIPKSVKVRQKLGDMLKASVDSNSGKILYQRVTKP